MSGLVSDLLAGVGELEAALGHEGGDSSMDHATYAKDALIPPMVKVRAAADALEGFVADDLWPLPTYQEMLHHHLTHTIGPAPDHSRTSLR